MLDENLRVLGRRISDLELDIENKKEAIEQLTEQRKDLEQKVRELQKGQD
jgi:prefoldin subunit 5